MACKVKPIPKLDHVLESANAKKPQWMVQHDRTVGFHWLLAQAGRWLKRYCCFVQALQWSIVLIYLALLLIPLWVALPNHQARILNHATLFAQFIFWGIWWPFVLISMLAFGRLWCGIFCPEGFLSEWASLKGLDRPIPRWMRWAGWPCVAFCLTTLYGQMISVYQYPKATALILGGSTVAAMLVGFIYTKGRRVWCRYLCPVNGVFNLFAKLAPMHYRVDQTAWDRSLSAKVTTPVICPTLQPLRHMRGNQGCHMCGRCSDYRQSISLAWRPSSHEIVELGAHETDKWQVILLLFGLLGIAIGAFHWTASPWFITLKLYLAEWLINQDIIWPLDTYMPWWLLTFYPEQNDVLSLLDGAVLIFYILATGMVMGLGLLGSLSLSIVSFGRVNWQRLFHLSQAFIPLACCGIFLGLSAVTVVSLKAEYLPMSWVNPTRLLLLGISSVWVLYLAHRILRSWGQDWRYFLAWLGVFLAVALINAAWGFMFWWW